MFLHIRHCQIFTHNDAVSHGLLLVLCSWFSYVTEETSNVFILIFSYLQLNVLRAKLDSLLNA